MQSVNMGCAAECVRAYLPGCHILRASQFVQLLQSTEEGSQRLPRAILWWQF